ncbi:MAG: 1-acyl-sn-glycerol-3-phosphate acyltransferase [Anaerolineales bacterium]|nr:1-acyl-sn-glycerol-3-phosphate acyltransferase [Anaerolineales bacterium]
MPGSTTGREYSLPWYSRLFRPVSLAIFRNLFRLLSRVQITGVENIPEEGAYVIAGNHVSIFEPPLIAAFWPRSIEVAGAVEILDRPIQSQIMRLYGTIPVHRGRFDRQLLITIVERLKAGRPVLIFPEGTRSRTPGMQQASTGAAYLAAKARVNVLPVGIAGTDILADEIRKFRRTHLMMSVGEMIELPEIPWRSAERKEILRLHTERIMHAIADLLPSGYHGFYAGGSR